MSNRIKRIKKIPLKKYTILGERNSGTNYLQKLIDTNFHSEITWDYGWKHFFGFSDYENSEDVIFIGIVRKFPDWANSLFIKPWHLQRELRKSKENFLSSQFWSYKDEVSDTKNGDEIIEDRNIYTRQRYNNIFDCRENKMRFLIEDMPKKVKNYILIRYEDLLYDFENTMTKIQKKFNFSIKTNNFPTNIKQINKLNIKKITNEDIVNNSNYSDKYEKIMGY